MACTKTIQDSVTWVGTILKNQPLQVSNWQPGLNFAQIVLDRILGPPMRWRFNRNNANFPISNAGGTDYGVSLPLFGWMETQWLVDGTGNIHQLEGAVCLAQTSASFRPKQIAPQYDDNAGNITFRLNAVPTASDTVYVDYQQKAPVLTGFGNTWSPVSDEYGYIYDQLFLALAGNLVNDARAQLWSLQGVSALLGAQDGLTAQQIAIFVGEWERVMRSVAASQDMGKMGSQALGR